MSADTPAELTLADVRKVARLARLALSEDELELARAHLAPVLGYMTRLGELDLESTSPLTHAGDTANRLADDVPGPTLSPDTIKRLAPQSFDAFIRVPKVLGDGGSA